MNSDIDCVVLSILTLTHSLVPTTALRSKDVSTRIVLVNPCEDLACPPAVMKGCHPPDSETGPLPGQTLLVVAANDRCPIQIINILLQRHLCLGQPRSSRPVDLPLRMQVPSWASGIVSTRAPAASLNHPIRTLSGLLPHPLTAPFHLSIPSLFGQNPPLDTPVHLGLAGSRVR